jgi:hypothetical protein
MPGENRASEVRQVQRPDPRDCWSSRSTPGAAGVLQEQSGDSSAQLALSGEGTSIGVAPGARAQCPGGFGGLVHAGAN